MSIDFLGVQLFYCTRYEKVFDTIIDGYLSAKQYNSVRYQGDKPTTQLSPNSAVHDPKIRM